MKEKIVFWLDGNFFSLLLANSLQQLMNCELYGVIDCLDKPKKFFQEQKFVNFQKTWFYHDHISINQNVDLNYLSSFEEKYDITLWLLAQNERLFNKYNEYHKFKSNKILSILEHECKLFEHILSEIKPDFFITVPTALHHHHLFHELCRSMGVKILMLNQANFGRRCIISQEHNKVDNLEKLNNIKTMNRNFEDLQKYLKTVDASEQLLDYKTKFIVSKKEKLKSAIQFLTFKNTNIKTHYGYYGRTKLRVLIKEIWYSLRTKYRESFINKNFNYDVDTERPFVYFTLHQEPERILLIGSPFYTNQLETIKNIAQSLPINYKLYVKDHPTQSIRGWHSLSFYKEILNLPNTVLIHPSVNSIEIIKKCSLVITVSGTAALEAAFYKKPSIVLSDIGYSVLPSVHKIKSVEDLPKVIRSSLYKKVEPETLDKYTQLVDENSFLFDYYDFILDYTNYFYYNGYLADVPITMEKMGSFITKHKPTFDLVAKEFVKKITEQKLKYK